MTSQLTTAANNPRTNGSAVESLIIVAAGIAAGLINAVAGAGTIVTFPVLVALGYPPVVANVSNTVGLIPASITGALGYRHEVSGHWRSVGYMAVMSLIGGAIGAALLIFLPAEAFSFVIPYLLILAAVLAAAQPAVARFVRRYAGESPMQATLPVTAGLMVGVFGTGIYGGYFGAAQGVILLALLGILWSTNLNRANGAKNVLAGMANVISAVVFLFSGLIDWYVALLVGIGAAIGGWIGSKIGRRLPATVLRAILVIIALTAAVMFTIN
jgi:uncharacterized protein